MCNGIYAKTTIKKTTTININALESLANALTTLIGGFAAILSFKMKRTEHTIFFMGSDPESLTSQYIYALRVLHDRSSHPVQGLPPFCLYLTSITLHQYQVSFYLS